MSGALLTLVEAICSSQVRDVVSVSRDSCLSEEEREKRCPVLVENFPNPES